MTNEKKKGSEKTPIKKIKIAQKPIATRRETDSAQPVLEQLKIPTIRKNTVTDRHTSADTSGKVRRTIRMKLRDNEKEKENK